MRLRVSSASAAPSDESNFHTERAVIPINSSREASRVTASLRKLPGYGLCSGRVVLNAAATHLRRGQVAFRTLARKVRLSSGECALHGGPVATRLPPHAKMRYERGARNRA